jgi:hypothetical protein
LKSKTVTPVEKSAREEIVFILRGKIEAIKKGHHRSSSRISDKQLDKVAECMEQLRDSQSGPASEGAEIPWRGGREAAFLRRMQRKLQEGNSVSEAEARGVFSIHSRLIRQTASKRKI